MLFRTEPGVWRFYTTDINNPESGLNGCGHSRRITPPAPGADRLEALYLTATWNPCPGSLS